MTTIIEKWFIKEQGDLSCYRFKLVCDNEKDLPDPNNFDDTYTVYMGSTAHIINTGETYMLNSSGEWKPQKKTDEEGGVTEEELRDNLDMAVKMICPNNAVIFDDVGNPSAMVFVPSFKLSEVLSDIPEELDGLHPAFIVNGQEIPGFWYSKYQNCIRSDRACSLPAVDPQTNIIFDAALAKCESKGKGWHLSTAAEWAAIALWCRKNNLIPNGNNDYGKDYSESFRKAIPTTKDENGKTLHVATGTGNLSWSHDATLAGIWDLNGNASEYQRDVRIIKGELQFMLNEGESWKAINAQTGEFVEPECSLENSTLSGNTVRLDFVDNAWVFTSSIKSSENSTRYCSFRLLKCLDDISERAQMRLRILALLPENDKTEYYNDRVWFNNASPYIVNIARGGAFNNNNQAGIFAIYGHLINIRATNTEGFRSSYIPELAVSSKKKAPSKTGTGTPPKHSFQPTIIDEEEIE